MSEYVNKTATMERNVQVNQNLVFIHPCRHAEVIKKLTTQAINNDKDIKVEDYLFIFLKFVSSVMPSLELDFTLEIEL